jgi:hypothetical protein
MALYLFTGYYVLCLALNGWRFVRVQPGTPAALGLAGQ